MRDPHVVALTYWLEIERQEDKPLTSFENASPLDHDTDEFTLHLADGVLTCTMKGHYATVKDARAVVDPYLRAWKLDDALRRDRREWRFIYQSCNIIYRDPTPGETPLSTVISAEVAVQASLQITRSKYPCPPTRFTASPDVATLWQRYEGYKQGREPLLALEHFQAIDVALHRAGTPGDGHPSVDRLIVVAQPLGTPLQGRHAAFGRPGQPVPGKHALDGDHEILAIRRNRLEKDRGGRGHLPVE
jgi:hypothetical protein